MENKSIAIEIGQRCRRFRNVLGISQQKLADMIGTTPQNISKYEKEGIHDIDIIRYLSNALGHDLMMDEVDEEGTVGEIGEEILSILVESKIPFSGESGKVDASDLFGGSLLFGLSKDRIIKELFKLEKIGLCVREQYVDFYGREKDVVFITAKGVITLKHISGLKNELDDYIDVKTYEMICKGHESYQAYLDSEPLKKIVGNISIKNGFRINYIHYLEKAFDVRESSLIYLEKYFPGESAYVDIIFSMIMGITRKKSDCMIRIVDECCSYEGYEEYVDLRKEIFQDGQKYKLVNILGKCVNNDLLEKNIDCDEWLNQRNANIEDMSRKQKEKYDRIRGVTDVKIKARHCKTCGAYYISNFTYADLKKNGTILCKVVTKKEYNNFIKNTEFVNLDFQSILAITGYTVNAQDNLSDSCRQAILDRAIHDGIYTKQKAINHISFLIKLNEDKTNMSNAVDKWKRDREFLTGIKDRDIVKISGIVK